MKRYLYEQIVEEASGHQTYYVDAKITRLGTPYHVGETDLDDDGDFGE